MRNIPSKLAAYFQLHTAIFLFGFTGILGRWINEGGLSGSVLVVYRLFFTLISLSLMPNIFVELTAMSRKEKWQIAGIGCIVALHWVTFYTSIQFSNVSIALSCLAVAPFFTSFIEPIFFKKKIAALEVILGVFTAIGVGFIYGFAKDYHLGIAIGISSALFAATFGVMNKNIADKYSTFSIMAVEFSGGLMLLILTLPIHLFLIPYKNLYPTDTNTWLCLLALAFLCTTVAYTLSIKSLRYVSAYTASLSINLEPIYGIILAYYFFQENKELTSEFYIGTAIIVSSVFLHPLLKDSKRMFGRK